MRNFVLAMRLVTILSAIILSFSLHAGEAIDSLLRRSQLDPKDMHTLWEISSHYLSKQDYEKAIEFGLKLQNEAYAQEDYHHYVMFSHLLLGEAYNAIGDTLHSKNNLGQARCNVVSAHEITTKEVADAATRNKLLAGLIVVLVALIIYICIKWRAKILEKRAKYVTSTLNDSKKQELFARIVKLMEEEKVYCDCLLTKDKLAEMLQTNRTYLSQVINEQTGKSFTAFLATYRVEAAVKRLSDPNDNTPLKALGEQIGFSSQTTFYNAFQQAQGMTPAAFRKKATAK